MNARKLIIALCAVALVAPIASAKKKKPIELLPEQVERLEAQVSRLTQEVDSLENALLMQKLDAAEKINDLLRCNNELKDSQAELNQRVDKAAPTIQIVGNLCSGRALAKDGAKYGYVDADGQMVITAQFEDASDFENGCAMVKLNDKWGVINTSGEIVIPCQYREIKEYNSYNNSKNLYIVRGDNYLYGIVAPGKVVQDCIYTDISQFDGDIAICAKGLRLDIDYGVCLNGEKHIARAFFVNRHGEIGKIGMLEENGNLIAPVMYKNLEVFVDKNGEYYSLEVEYRICDIYRNGKKVSRENYN